jgi:hypothetical protein
VKPLALLMFQDRQLLESALGMLAARLGGPDHVGSPSPFRESPYYEAEMGPDLVKLVASFPRLLGPHKLPWLKAVATAIERELAVDAKRRVNVDPGYIDFYKVVLASSKCGWPKIYVGRGTWADPVLRFYGGRFEPFPWTFPDFKDGRYLPDLTAIRDLYRHQIRKTASSA